MRTLFSFSAILGLSLFAAAAVQAQCQEGDCENGWGLMRLEDEFYRGQFKDGKYHGKGFYFLADSTFYETDWVEGYPQDEAIAVFYAPDGQSQSMIWKGQAWLPHKVESLKMPALEPEANQRAEVVRINCLVGNCHDSKGAIAMSEDNRGRRYQGQFLNGLYHGHGVMTYSNGDVYEGQFERGMPNGQGKYVERKTGRPYEGLWLDGRFQGQGSSVMKVWVLIVGVADYQNIAKLKYTTKDAEMIHQFFIDAREGGGAAVPRNQIRLIKDEEATTTNVLNAMYDLFGQADTTDLIVFYFAGHGKEGGFLPVDYNRQKGNMISHDMINTAFSESKAKYKLLVADACHSGSFPQTKSATRSTMDVSKRIQRFYRSFEGKQAGMAVILSSAAEEVSLEANRFQHGVFSFFFLRAMQGQADADKDGIVTVKELFGYIHREVRGFTFGYQNPMLQGKFDEEMPVGLSPE